MSSPPQQMNVAMMTSGGLAPCLSSSVAYLIEFWSAALKAGSISGLSIRMYIDGYKGVLTGESMVLDPALYEECSCLHDLGGSPIGNSRVKVSVHCVAARLLTYRLCECCCACSQLIQHRCCFSLSLSFLDITDEYIAHQRQRLHCTWIREGW